MQDASGVDQVAALANCIAAEQSPSCIRRLAGRVWSRDAKFLCMGGPHPHAQGRAYFIYLRPMSTESIDTDAGNDR
ncbi:MAG: hypothetical protein HN337_01695 [Deltaproteobacteria bacterium]|nr:hypothetical protein [Deltaproteobacteria bacterium]